MEQVIILLETTAILIGFAYLLRHRRQDVTHAVEDHTKTQRAVREREKSRVEFISIVSHQLRTPLSIIRGYLEALNGGDVGPVSPGQKEYLSEALTIDNEMIKLVNDYLEVGRMDPRKITLNRAPADVGAIVERIVHELRPLAKASNVDVDFSAEPNLPLLDVDSVKLKQVVLNILSNALKYTRHAGTVIVRLKRDVDRVVFSCQDTGVGIPKEQQREIFTRFFRAQNVARLDTQGSGLGLYVAKSIVEAHGGEIWFESKEHVGTTVSFSLPIR